MKVIELLYFDDCPSWQITLENLRVVIAADHLPYEVRLVKIDTPEQAQSEHFLGSPSIHINGEDLWPESRGRFDLSCRVYQTEQGLRGSPTVDMLRKRIHSRLA